MNTRHVSCGWEHTVHDTKTAPAWGIPQSQTRVGSRMKYRASCGNEGIGIATGWKRPSGHKSLILVEDTGDYHKVELPLHRCLGCIVIAG